MNKVEFVMSLPEKMSAKEVQKRAAKKGIQIGENYVHVIRSKHRHNRPKSPNVAECKPIEPVVESTNGNGNGHNQSEGTFMNLVLNIGVIRANELVEKVAKVIF